MTWTGKGKDANLVSTTDKTELKADSPCEISVVKIVPHIPAEGNSPYASVLRWQPISPRHIHRSAVADRAMRPLS